MTLYNFILQLKNDLWNERLKFIILLFLFLFQVIVSITTIFYLEDILALFNIEWINPIPLTGEAAFADFLGDQMLFGILIMSLGTMNIFAAEIDTKSISYSLTRPISRTEYSIARLVARLIALILPLIIATFVGWGFMALIFEIFPLDRLIFSLLFLILLFLFLGVTTSALSTRVSALTAGLVAIVFYIILFTLSVIQPIELISPFTYSALWIDFLMNNWVPFNEIVLKLFLLGSWILVPFFLMIYSMKTRDFC